VQRRRVASLLVAAVTRFLVVPKRLDAELLRSSRYCQTCIVYQYYLINNIVRQFVVRRFNVFARYRREEDDDFFFKAFQSFA